MRGFWRVWSDFAHGSVAAVWTDSSPFFALAFSNENRLNGTWRSCAPAHRDRVGRENAWRAQQGSQPMFALHGRQIERAVPIHLLSSPRNGPTRAKRFAPPIARQARVCAVSCRGSKIVRCDGAGVPS